MDEAAGNYLYDLSRTGNVYHKNNTNLNQTIQWERGVGAVPSATIWYFRIGEQMKAIIP
jgi:hypothetical protein